MGNNPRLRILLADDDALLREIAAATLQQAGYEVTTAASGEAALTAAAQQLPDLALLDVDMPDGDGYQACSRLRALPGGRDLPIVMVTGHEDRGSIDEAYEAGATDFVSKPVNWALLVHRLRYILRGSGTLDALRLSEQKNGALLRAMPDGIFLIDAAGSVAHCFSPLAALPEASSADPSRPRCLFDELPGEIRPRARESLAACLAGQSAAFEFSLETAATRLRHYECRYLPNAEGQVLAIVRDISERKAAESRIHRLAYFDTLTGLPNRTQFSVQLERRILAAQAQGQKFAVFVMDLDRFKYVNDTLGHGVGDHVLRSVTARLSSLLEYPDCVARLGGDEFALLVTAEPAAKVAQIAAAIITALEEPIVYEEQPLDVGVSIGIATYPEHGSAADTLVRNADIAMYVAKRSRSGYALYDPQYDSTQQRHLSLLGELRRAVEQNELRLVYQPKVTLASATTSAAEALIRWQHPHRGVIPPADFIPFAEHTGYIKVLTRWVLAEAIRQCAIWYRSGLDIHVSVNLSARDLMNRDLPELIGSLLASEALPAHRIGLEITESGFMEDPAHAQRVLGQLAAMGLQLSIDDYGTGYSSLSYLMTLPVNELKIDRAFVSRVYEDAHLSTIVRSTIELGHSLGLKVVAEGVEDPRGLALLRELQCDSAQGYYMSPPLPAEDFQAWLLGRPRAATDAATLEMAAAARDSSSDGIAQNEQWTRSQRI
ncbi:MAG: EAL domain-containing protein [Steroidobacteraceae bacterium]